MIKLSVSESYSDSTLYCVVGFDDDKMQSTQEELAEDLCAIQW